MFTTFADPRSTSFSFPFPSTGVWWSAAAPRHALLRLPPPSPGPSPAQSHLRRHPPPRPPVPLTSPWQPCAAALFCSTATAGSITPHNPPEKAEAEPPPTRSLTTQQKHLSSCVQSLPADFTASDLSSSLLSLSDPDMAYDLFCWASLRPNFRHSPLSYHTILRISISHRRLSRVESLLDDVLSGACPKPDLHLIHTAIRFCCTRPRLLPRAFEFLNRLPRFGLRPSLDTFHPLLTALVRRLDRHPAYMHAVRSLSRRMKVARVAPDTLASNLLIRAYSRCLLMDDALRVFDEMQIHPNCEPNEYTYGYLARGMCEKGRTWEGVKLYKEMRGKGLVPSARVYMALVNCLSMDRSHGEAVEVVTDMLHNGLKPDLITCRTLLEGLCREGKEEEAKALLEEVRSKRAVDEKTYLDLVDGMRWLCPEFRQ